MTSRTVNLHITTNEKEELTRETGMEQFQHAIGYLAAWALQYPKVNIYRDGPTDLVANYFNDQNQPTYTIGAVWHDDHYGFHS